MIRIDTCCFICNKKLKPKEDKLHFRCQDCKIDWHIEDFNGKMERIIKLLNLPKDKDSQTYIQTDRNAYTLCYNHIWFIWGIKFTQNKKENKRTDILFIHKRSKLEFLVKNWKKVVYFSKRKNHCWYYEIFLKNTKNNKEIFIIDGEYIGKNETLGRQGNLIDEVMKRLNPLLEKAEFKSDKLIQNIYGLEMELQPINSIGQTIKEIIKK